MTYHLRLKRGLKLLACSLMVLLCLQHPLVAWAQEAGETTPQPSTETQPAPAETVTPTVSEPTPAPITEAPAPADQSNPTVPTTQRQTTGPQQPTGESAPIYTYNEQNGHWENEHYSWDPVTKQTQPKQPTSYSYNPATKLWDTNEWRYNPATGRYEENVVTISEPPAGASIDLAPEVIAALGLPVDDQGRAILPEGGLAELRERDPHIFDLFYNASISNRINSFAQSGDATVSYNTLAGNATSGDASAMLNLINLLYSSWGFDESYPLLYFANYFGDLTGDLRLDPDALAASGCSACQSNAHLDFESEVNATIENNIVLGAQSGDATVSYNTEAGDATTGGATVVANIINLIGSAIAGGQSFFGVLNVFGNLTGDILFPDGFLDTFMQEGSAQNQAGPSQNQLNDADFYLNDSQAISNNVDLSAQSGDATVSYNTLAGNATSGDASTGLTIINLASRQIIGENVMLVFVNVLGNWLGMILDAPAGTTSAALGGGIQQDTCLGCGSEPDFYANTDASITNNVTLAAQSGDATVSYNTEAGNAASGDASASANIVNITNSQLSLANWFGIFFINIFGDWTGSFGVDTLAGNPPQPATNRPKKNNQFVQSSSTTAPVNTVDPDFFVLSASNQSPDDESEASSGGVVSPQAPANSIPQAEVGNWNLYLWVGLFALGSGSILAAERFVRFRNQPPEALV